MQVANPSKRNGCRYGIIPLSIENDKCSFLVFGGFSSGGFMQRTGIFTTMINNFVDSDFTILEMEEIDKETEIDE